MLRCSFGRQWVRTDSIPSAEMITISPGSTSRTNSAPTASSAQDSLLTTQAPRAVRPIHSGRNPFGSRNAIIRVAVMTMQE